MEHRQAMETPITEEGVRDDAPTAPQMSFGWTFEPLPLAEAMRLARASRIDEAEYAMLREHLTRGCIGKKGAPYAARFWDVMNDWGVSRI